MQISDVIQSLKQHTNKNISQAEVANILGISALALNKRIMRHSELKMSEVLKLINHYGYNLFDDYIQNGQDKTNSIKTPDAVEILYYENPSLNATIKNPLITSIWLDRELVHNVWKKDEKDLKILKMPGDAMNGGEAPIRNQDMLIVDISCKDILSSGIYAYTTNNDNFIFINGIKQTVDGSVIFYFFNKTYGETVYNQEELKNVNFKVLGRMIKNMSALN